MPRAKTGRARPHKIQTCLNARELDALAGALSRAHAHPAQQKIAKRWRISPSRLLTALATAASRDDESIAAAAAAHAADRVDPRGKGGGLEAV
jgi:hypothetical protein